MNKKKIEMNNSCIKIKKEQMSNWHFKKYVG